MRKRNDHDVFGIASALFDHRSAAFQQKMFRHFQSSGHQHSINIEKMPERKKHENVILYEESA